MLSAFAGAAIGAILAGAGRRVHTIERDTVYRDVDYDKFVDALFKEADEREKRPS